MGLDPWLVGAAALLLLAVLALKLRGPSGRADLTGPRKPGPRLLSREEMDRLTALVAGGAEEEAVRRLKSAGYDEAAARQLVRLAARLTADSEG